LEYPGPSWPDARQKIAEALRARLAQPEEPDWSAAGFGKPQREWQGLTDEQVKQIEMSTSSKLSAIYLAEAQLKGKNAL
jgi:hypothetical protein